MTADLKPGDVIPVVYSFDGTKISRYPNAIVESVRDMPNGSILTIAISTEGKFLFIGGTVSDSFLTLAEAKDYAYQVIGAEIQKHRQRIAVNQAHMQKIYSLKFDEDQT